MSDNRIMALPTARAATASRPSPAVLGQAGIANAGYVIQDDEVLTAAVEMLAARRALEFAPTSRPIDSELARHERAIEALQAAVALRITNACGVK